MANIAKQLTELIGGTPLLELSNYSTAKGLQTPIIAKVEFSTLAAVSKTVSPSP